MTIFTYCYNKKSVIKKNVTIAVSRSEWSMVKK